MSLLDGFLPPPGAPGAVRDAAVWWRRSAEGLQAVADRTSRQSGVLGGSWRGPAHSAFAAAAEPFLAALAAAVAPLHEVAGGLEQLADGVEAAQAEYHQRMLAVGLTAAAGVVLTPLTLAGSDEAAAAAITVELAAATELATGAAEVALGVLAAAADQAVALAARWVVLSGAAIGADAASAAVVHGPDGVVAHLHLSDDVELALVGAVAVPIGAELSAVLSGGPAATAAGGLDVARRLAVGGASLASADTLVRAALGQGLDPGELAMMALPVGRLGHGAPNRLVPLGFASQEEFAGFARDLVGGLREAGYGDVVPVFQGSAVTGVKYTTGAPFDVGRRSDFDIALASPTLFERARAAGVKLRSRGTRTAPLDENHLQRLGLDTLTLRLTRSVEREVHFMVYKDLTSAVERSGGIRLP